MSEIERTARLLDDIMGASASNVARRLHEDGLVLLPIEPDEATVEEMAKALCLESYTKCSEYLGGLQDLEESIARCVDKFWRDYIPDARAAYRAAVSA